MDDQVAVRVRDGGEHVEEQAQARVDAERVARRSRRSIGSPST